METENTNLKLRHGFQISLDNGFWDFFDAGPNASQNNWANNYDSYVRYFWNGTQFVYADKFIKSTNYYPTLMISCFSEEQEKLLLLCQETFGPFIAKCNDRQQTIIKVDNFNFWFSLWIDDVLYHEQKNQLWSELNDANLDWDHLLKLDNFVCKNVTLTQHWRINSNHIDNLLTYMVQFLPKLRIDVLLNEFIRENCYFINRYMSLHFETLKQQLHKSYLSSSLFF